MVIQHNLSALNANRQLGIVFNSLEKSTEKLSSGYKINRAADDAAGLSISEKMRKQIRGLSQAAENIQDGISLCQVADGALNETVDILQRMNELSIQSANGTNSISDRKDIQLEIDLLSSEIDRIADTTSFNECIYPLKGSTTTHMINTGTSNTTNNWLVPPNFYEGTWYISVSSNASPNANILVDGSNCLPGDSKNINVLRYKTEISGTTYYGYYYDLSQTSGSFRPPDYYNNASNVMATWEFLGTSYSGMNTFAGLTDSYYSTKLSDIKIENNTGYVYINSKNTGSKVYFYTENINNNYYFGTTTNPSSLSSNCEIIKGIPDNSTPQNPNNINQTNHASINNKKSVWIQSTDETNKGLSINLVDASMSGLFSETTALSVLTENDCDIAIDKINSALKVASSYRSYFGSIQNRLEHAYNINLNTVENTQFAESQIRDTDMASEMVKYSNSSILSQAGQAMLAQANQSNQGVLSLIA